MSEAFVEFCGEEHPLAPERSFTIGREADLSIDDNPYLHRHFLRIEARDGLWWLQNVGSSLTATVSDTAGSFQAYLAPGTQIPLVFPRTTIRFSAGATTYELEVNAADSVFDPPAATTAVAGETTAAAPTINLDQKLLLVALAERALRNSDRSVSALPSSHDAATRLGWSLTRFNRKLDYLCQKLARTGVRGLHGTSGQLASNRRFRLIEYALAARLVTAADLELLDESPRPVLADRPSDGCEIGEF